MTFWINVVSAPLCYGAVITFPMKFRPGTTRICAQNTWDNFWGKQMLLVTCDTAICLPAIVAKFGEEYRNRIQAFKSNAVCSWPSDANVPTICVKVPRIWIFSCLECSDGGGRLTKWGINFQLNFPLKVLFSSDWSRGSSWERDMK